MTLYFTTSEGIVKCFIKYHMNVYYLWVLKDELTTFNKLYVGDWDDVYRLCTSRTSYQIGRVINGKNGMEWVGDRLNF